MFILNRVLIKKFKELRFGNFGLGPHTMQGENIQWRNWIYLEVQHNRVSNL